VCGQIAGAFYGAEAIPAAWRARLALCAEILQLADQLHDRQLSVDIEPGL
jgi:ADP-ribosyl-[dinitrogen reductase] hydrolase